MASQSASPAWLERPIVKDPAKLFTLENLIIVLVLTLAVLSRFMLLGERTMSHDEVNHVVPSYDLYQGRGYRHDPITHGPFQFHVVALSYFLFGDNDYSSRIPAATFSVAAVAFVIFAFRRYLGRAGALIAGILFLISPFMLFYGRYTRNEGFIELIGVLLLYGILRFLEKGDRVGMFLVTIATAMHFIVKETAFIYTAQAMIFLFFVFLVETRRAAHKTPGVYKRFLTMMVAAALLFVGVLGLAVVKADQTTGSGTVDTATATQTATVPATPASLIDPAHLRLYVEIIGVGLTLGLALFALVLLARQIGWSQIRGLRSFTLLILLGTLILPMLAPFPVNMLGWNPLDYSNTASMLRTGVFVFLFFVIAAAVGIWWNPILWLQNALLFYALFTVFYTTFFTNIDGFFTGIVGSLGYWISQQGVERGSQPLYYYALIQMPVYEFLGVLGTLLAIYFGIRYRRFSTLPGYSPAFAPREAEENETLTQYPAEEDPAQDLLTPRSDGPGAAAIPPGSLPYPYVDEPVVASVPPVENLYACPRAMPVLLLFVFWGITSLAAFSIAGERMPWLTVHITMGFLLAAGWGLGFLVDTTNWKSLTRWNGLLAVLLIPVLYASLAGLLGTLLGANPPFQGKTLEQLQATSRFLITGIATLASLAGLGYLLRSWSLHQILRLAAAVFFLIMGVLTARAAYRASYVNYDEATEYMVYAHGAPGPKEVLQQVEEISRRTSGDKTIQVAYGGDALYPYWWYFRDYPNHRWFQTTPTRDLREAPIVIAGEDIYDKLDPILGNNFDQFDYIRLWWPNQDYYDLTWERIRGVLVDPQMREAVFNIWLNRDYSEYAKLTNHVKELSLETWSPAARMRMYIRKDIVAKIWNYGAGPAAANPAELDPYAQKMVQLAPAQVAGATGSQPGQFQAPRGIKVAPDGSLFVADSRNHRIQHLAADGSVIKTWGTFGDISQGNAPGGTFNEPWDVAVGNDGSVFVSDTWNHRIQKFTPDGQFVKMWGYFGQGEKPEAFWGPRGLAVDASGRLYVVDTGNKRVVIFDPDGNYVAQFGGAGTETGQFDEPVGVAIDQNGLVYVADTWNLRIQVLAPAADGTSFTAVRTWDVAGWEGETLENKPFLAVSPVDQHVFVTDPEKPRVLEFDAEGNFVRGWGDYSTGPDGFGVASGIAVAPDGNVWVSDGANNVLLKFIALK